MFMKGKVFYVACGKCTAGREHSDGFLDDSVFFPMHNNSVIQFKNLLLNLQSSNFPIFFYMKIVS